MYNTLTLAEASIRERCTGRGQKKGEDILRNERHRQQQEDESAM
jgi:hypothetical protein